MSQRFFSESPIPPSPGSCVRLLESEAHHFLHVMRGSVGDRVTLFDGRGCEYLAEATEVGRRHVTLAVLSQQEVDREPSIAVTLGVALPKGDRQKVLVEKLTELGVRRLVPLRTERSVAAPKTSGLDKLRRAVVEASKQCGRNRLMAIEGPLAFEAYLAQAEADARLIAHPDIKPQPAADQPRSVAVAVGPEGGFTAGEVALASDAGWGGLVLGRAILRIETAAIAAAARFTTW